MKKIMLFFTMAVLVAFAAPVFAATTVSKVPFANISGVDAEVQYSAVVNASGYKTKTLTVSGVNLAGTAFQNMSGTVLAQCGPSPTGPWSTCTQSQVASAPAVSLTANNQLTWSDAVTYVRLKWTSGTVATKLKAWLNLLDN
ncbi:MAG: hypothetical protein PHI31_09760 [Desulfuromonadaceae bacterium]|nr:hypothetical protein [Desulfuromonadaceae bacterium]